ncbi:hypothetical protein [Streptomyces naphthomycinicus]|uniref:hypothetical protein n=1 Tax=Streptomyces naphthomycinicus TaxID=2872625 RepID=UPI001CECC038|nr:hypothetical protein [Streptomyces sp. TML10]
MNQTLNPRIVGTAETVADLQSMLGTFSINDEADVAGYYSARDGGGGSFFFEGTPPPSATLKNATLDDKEIVGVTGGSPIVITALGHGFTTGQSVCISGVTGITVNGPWLITKRDDDSFWLNGSAGNGTWGGNPKATSVTVTTREPHRLVSGVQAMIAGVQGMPGINKTWGPIGVIGSETSTTFTIPARDSEGAGTYMSGGLVGDGGVTIPSAVVNGRWLRRFDTPGHYHFQDFGGVPDWNGTSTPGTDNLAVMNTILAAIHAEANKSAKIILRGWLYFSDTITITRGVVIEGTGMSDPNLHLGGPGSRVSPGTWLGFPRNKTAFRIKGGNPEPEGYTSSAWFTMFRDLTISCEGPGASSGYGVHATAPIYMHNVIVGKFGGANVFLDGVSPSVPLARNPGGSVLTGCLFWQGKSEGLLLAGIGATVCLIQGCYAIGNDVGFHDMSPKNVFVACHGEGNKTYNFLFERSSNSSLHGCYSEGETRASLTYLNDAFGGSINRGPHFGVHSGVMRGRPLTFENRQGLTHIETKMGEDYKEPPPPGARPNGDMIFSEMVVYDPDSKNQNGRIDSLRWRYFGTTKKTAWITLDSFDTKLEVLRIPTNELTLRRSAPYYPNGIYLGKPPPVTELPKQMVFQAGPSPEPTTPRGYPQSYEVGDTIWKSNPTAGDGVWAQRCVVAGTLHDATPVTKPKGHVSEAGTFVVTSPWNQSYLAVGQYISVALLDGGATKQITDVNVSGKTVTYTPPGGTVGDTEITLVPPVFETLYAANGPSVTTGTSANLRTDQRFVTVTAEFCVITLPESPFDGETHEIKGKGDFTVTIAGQGANIDGTANYTQSTPRSNTRVRFNILTGEWEIR